MVVALFPLKTRALPGEHKRLSKTLLKVRHSTTFIQQSIKGDRLEE